MRVLGVTIVGLAIVAIVAAWSLRGGSDADPGAIPANEIHVTGTGNTLASLAAQLNAPHRFTYDETTHTATCRSGLLIDGDLVIGRPDDPGFNETLEMDTKWCGDLRITVRPGGALRMYHSRLQTVSQVLSSSACSQGYSLNVDGELTLIDSEIRYISGSASKLLRGQARAEIRGSTFSYCDGNALRCIEADGSRIVIQDSVFRGAGSWAVVVEGSGGDPITLRDCLLESQVGDVFLTGEAPSVRLIDCVFNPRRIQFNRPTGQVEVAWTRRFKVVDGRTGQPRAGVAVRLSRGDAHVESRTDEAGVAELAARVYVVRPDRQLNPERTADGATWRVSVLDEDGEAVAELSGVEIRAKDDALIIVEVN